MDKKVIDLIFGKQPELKSKVLHIEKADTKEEAETAIHKLYKKYS